MDAASLCADLAALRQKKPLIHNITNFVVMNWTANALLALGASPVMAHAKEEVADMVRISDTLVVNIGTLDSTWIDSMESAISAANIFGKPVVFDPVGLGATPYRAEATQRLLKAGPISVIRGNASEIMSLAGVAAKTRGVDAATDASDASEAARDYAKKNHCVVCVSGEVDYICAPDALAEVHNGTLLMTRVTGMGCAATALIGAFLAVQKSSFLATTHAMALCGICGEIAAEKGRGPGEFQAAFLDALYTVEEPEIEERMRALIL